MTKIRNIYGSPLRYSEYYFIFLELDRDRAKDILFSPRPLHHSSDSIYNEGNDLSDFTQTCSPSTMKVYYFSIWSKTPPISLCLAMIWYCFTFVSNYSFKIYFFLLSICNEIKERFNSPILIFFNDLHNFVFLSMDIKPFVAFIKSDAS